MDPSEPFRETEETTWRETPMEVKGPFENREGEIAPAESGVELRQDAMSHRKAVSFTHLDFRTYNVTIGDHPCCMGGLPITLDWDYVEEGVLPIDQYESERNPRRSRAELRKTCEERHQILVEDGHSEEELRRAQRKLHRSRSCSAKLCNKVKDSFFQNDISNNTTSS